MIDAHKYPLREIERLSRGVRVMSAARRIRERSLYIAGSRLRLRRESHLCDG